MLNSIIRSTTPLSQEDIIRQLQNLREHSLIESSHYAVSAIIEIKLDDNTYAYVSGVNIENHEHNRLSMHAEQNALATAQTLLGGNIRFSKLWVMGAPNFIKSGSNHPLADNHAMSCGHCRQLLISCAANNAEIHPVSVNGKVGSPLKLNDLLPHAFSERDLEISVDKTKIQEVSTRSNSSSVLFNVPKTPTITILTESSHLESSEILKYLRCISPHIIDEKFKTSSIRTCIIKLDNPTCYIPGTLVQDIAFLTTDAIFTALGHAITRFGADKLNIAEIFFYGDSLQPSQLCGSELQHLGRFVKRDIPVYFYATSGERKSFTFSECLQAKLSSSLLGLKSEIVLSQPVP